jgi:hypothetical protein
MRILEKLVRFLSELIGLKTALQDQEEAEGFEPSAEVLAPNNGLASRRAAKPVGRFATRLRPKLWGVSEHAPQF